MGSELLLKNLNHLLVQHEGLGQDIRVDRRVRPKHGVGDGDGSRILTAECGEGDRRILPDVELEVNHPDGEYEGVSLVQNLGKEAVPVLVRRHEADEERPLEDGEEFGGARVSVGRVQAVGREVYARRGNAEGVEARELVDEHGRHVGALRVVRVSRDVQPSEHEVLRVHFFRVLAEFPIHEHYSKEIHIC